MGSLGCYLFSAIGLLGYCLLSVIGLLGWVDGWMGRHRLGIDLADYIKGHRRQSRGGGLARGVENGISGIAGVSREVLVGSIIFCSLDNLYRLLLF